MASLLDEISGGVDLGLESDAYKRGVKRTEFADLISDGLPGAVVTDTDRPHNAGYGADNSRHKIPNSTVDLRLTKGITKDSVRKFYESRGYETAELLGPGDSGHDDHVHYSSRGMKEGKQSMPSSGFSNNSMLDSVYAEITGETAPQFAEEAGVANRTSPVVDVASAGRDLKTRNVSAIAAADSALRIFDESANKMQAVQDARESNLTTANQQIDTINTEVQKDTTELLSRIQDPLARIAAIDTRMEEIASMSPIQATMKAIFNPNYSVKHLEKLRYAAQVKVENAGNEFQQTTMLQDRLSGIIGMRYENEDKFNQLIENGAKLDTSIATDHLGLTLKAFDTVVQGVNANSAVLQAMDQAEDVTLNTIQPSQINVALAQAKKSKDGMVNIGGVSIPVQKLQFRADQLEQQELAIENARLANATRNIEMKQAAEMRMISHMSSSELKEAARTGTHKGMRLDANALNNAYTSSLQTQALSVDGTLTDMQANTFSGQLAGISRESRAASDNLRSIGAANNKQVADTMNRNTARIRQLGEVIKNAPANQRPALQAKFAEEVAGMRGTLDVTLDKVAEGYSASPAGRATIKSWLKGQPQSAADTVDGIIALTRGGTMPPGISPRTAGGKAIKAASDAQAKVIAANPKASAVELSRLVRTAVSKAVSDNWTEAVGTQMVSEVVASARADGHPAGKIRDQDWRNALKAGDAAAWTQYGQQVGLTPEQAKAVFGGGPDSAKFKQFAKTRAAEGETVDYKTVMGQLQAIQTATTLRTLDNSSSATGNFRPSEALGSYMNSAGFQSKVGTIDRFSATSGFDSNLASTASAGAMPKAIANQALNFRSVADSIDADRQKQMQDRVGIMPQDSKSVASMILFNMPNLNPTDATTLERAIAAAGGNPRDVVMGPKFQDPKLAKIQAIAAKNWDDMHSYLIMKNQNNPFAELALDRASR